MSIRLQVLASKTFNGQWTVAEMAEELGVTKKQVQSCISWMKSKKEVELVEIIEPNGTGIFQPYRKEADPTHWLRKPWVSWHPTEEALEAL